VELEPAKVASVDTLCEMLGNIQAFAELDLEGMFAKFTEEGTDEV
jgi:hypothetical protein